MKSRVVIFNGMNPVSHPDLSSQFLFDLTRERLLRRFPRFQLPARKLPATLANTCCFFSRESQITAAATLIVFIDASFLECFQVLVFSDGRGIYGNVFVS